MHERGIAGGIPCTSSHPSTAVLLLAHMPPSPRSTCLGRAVYKQACMSATTRTQERQNSAWVQRWHCCAARCLHCCCLCCCCRHVQVPTGQICISSAAGSQCEADTGGEAQRGAGQVRLKCSLALLTYPLTPLVGCALTHPYVAVAVVAITSAHLWVGCNCWVDCTFQSAVNIPRNRSVQ